MDRTPPAASRDTGMTLPEVVVVIALLGIITAVVVGAVTVVFRTEDGIANTVAETHDVQQAVNYFPLDVQSGPVEVAAYETTPGAIEPGCGDTTATNVISFESGERRIAYLSTTDGDVVALDRYECERSGSGWAVSSSVNIADSLDGSNGTPVEVTVVAESADASIVDEVVMRFSQDVETPEVIASPNVDVVLDPEVLAGVCTTDNPVAAARDFGAFVETDVHIAGGMIEGPLAIGGTLTWTPNTTVAQAKANAKYHGVGLYVGSIGWGTTSTKLAVFKGDIVIGGPAHESSKKIYRDASGAGQYVEMNGGAKFVPLASYANPIDFAAAFDELRACSGAIASLPASCTSCAHEVTILDPDRPSPNNQYVPGSSSKMKLDITGPGGNILNLPESYISSSTVQEFSHQGGLSQSKPLIVNVIDDGDGVVDFSVPSSSWQNLGNQKNVLVNFPNATTVNFTNRFNGAVLAPFADVTTGQEFSGSVIASSWTHTAGTVHNDKDPFDGNIDFDS